MPTTAHQQADSSSNVALAYLRGKGVDGTPTSTSNQAMNQPPPVRYADAGGTVRHVLPEPPGPKVARTAAEVGATRGSHQHHPPPEAAADEANDNLDVEVRYNKRLKFRAFRSSTDLSLFLVLCRSRSIGITPAPVFVILTPGLCTV